MFSRKFICASYDYSTMEKKVPAPYLRRVFEANVSTQATLTVCGLGFYKVYLNGEEITKGALAPYISNPDDILYYDTYTLTGRLLPGRNVLGFVLGNGMLNCPGGQVWDFDQAVFRSSPKLAMALELKDKDASTVIEADQDFRCAPSPIFFDDLRAGEWYDARREIPGWNLPDFDDSSWTPALKADPPRGQCRLCQADPIVVTRELKPVSIRPAKIGKNPHVRENLPVIPKGDIEKDDAGYLYDFGVNAAGLCRLKIHGRPGQKIVLQFGEALDDNGDLDLRGMEFLPLALDHRDVYICKGAEEDETYTPSFTYHGFRYVLVMGLDSSQAVNELLTYEVMNSDLRQAGAFTCSDDMLNRIQNAALVSDLANFYYFPTDCPHREKNGWTGDASVSAEQILLNFHASDSYKEWLRNIIKAQREDGALPGIVPTSGWGYYWGNGPAWDCVLIYLPYYIWKYTGDVDIIFDTAHAILRYLDYIASRRDQHGLIHIGLGDWLESGHSNKAKSPLVFTDTVRCMEMCQKAAVLFEAAGHCEDHPEACAMQNRQAYACRLYQEFRTAARRYLIDFSTMTALGSCQCSQSMAIFYDVFDPGEKPAAFQRLLKFIEQAGGHMDVGMMGARVLFRVLSQFGRTDLAYHMITTTEYPSYGNWIANGATSLEEQFLPKGRAPASKNHHFFGDVSGWMYENPAGLHINPYDRDHREVLVFPRIIPELSSVTAYHDLPEGRVSVCWKRTGEHIMLNVQIPDGVYGTMQLEDAWQFDDGTRFHELKSGEYVLLPESEKDKYCEDK